MQVAVLYFIFPSIFFLYVIGYEREVKKIPEIKEFLGGFFLSYEFIANPLSHNLFN